MTNLREIQSSAVRNYPRVENTQPDQKSSKAESHKASIKEDQVNISYSSNQVAKYNRDMILSASNDGGLSILREMVVDVFEKQELSTKVATDDGELDINTLDPESARELIAEDGYFGVKNTSERIFKLAVGIAGGDPSRIDAVRKGVKQGFEEALDAFGGWLPELSHDTFDAVMSKLDDWAKTLQAESSKPR